MYVNGESLEKMTIKAKNIKMIIYFLIRVCSISLNSAGQSFQCKLYEVKLHFIFYISFSHFMFLLLLYLFHACSILLCGSKYIYFISTFL